MLKLKYLLLASALALSVQGCVIDEPLKNDSLQPLSAKEVSEMLPGNTFTTTGGDSYYFDVAGNVAGGGSRAVIRGRWSVTGEGKLCMGAWNGSSSEPSCFKVFFDKVSGSHKLLDSNGDTKFEIKESVKGNSKNF